MHCRAWPAAEEVGKRMRGQVLAGFIKKGKGEEEKKTAPSGSLALEGRAELSRGEAP